MSDSVVIYYNPRCSKSRQALQLLRDRDIEPKIVDYLETPPSLIELKRFLRLLRIEPRELMRRNEAEYKEAGLDDPTLTRDQLIHALHEHPNLLERPIVLANGKAALGRPPELILEIL